MPPAEAVAAPTLPLIGVRRRLLEHVRTPLHRDGYALVANSAFTAVTGLLYWVVAANAYSPHSLGVNSALISSMMFLAGVASLNLTNVLVRFLPHAGERATRMLAWSYGVTALVAAVAGVIFVAGLGTWSPRLAFVASDGAMPVWFVVSTVGWCLFAIQDAALTALGRAVWVPVENAGFSLLKLALLVAFATLLPDYGIFVSWTLAMLLAVAIVNSLVFARLVRRVRASTRREPLDVRDSGFRRYLAADYSGSIAWLAAINLLPLIVTGVAGATTNAYFALAWAVAFPLYAVSANIGMSLVLHAAADGASLPLLLAKAVRQSLLVLLPLVAALVLFAPLALRLFGHGYSHESAALLRLLAIGALPNAVLALAVSVARVRRRMRPGAVALAAHAGLSLGLAVPLLHAMGVTGAGVAWLASLCAVAALVAVATRLGAFGDELAGMWSARVYISRLRAWAGELASGAAARRSASTETAERALADNGLPVRSPRAVRTDSDVVVLMSGGPDTRRHVVKVAWSPAGERALAAQAAALVTVRCALRLDGHDVLVPKTLASGWVDGRRYLVESGLPGVDGRRFASSPARERALTAIARGMATVYEATAVHDADSELAIALVEARIDAISRAAGTRWAAGFDTVRRLLADGLDGRSLPAARGHGDLWLGNALLSPNGEFVTGLLDWEASGFVELPVTDLAHLVISTRALTSGRELGHVARRLMEGRDRFTDFELGLLAPYAGRGQPLDTRTIVLLAWVQHCAQRLEQGTLHARGRWLRRNVQPVLAALEA